MREEKTEVTAYSGYRGEESPKTFVRQEKSIAVVEIVKRWIEEEARHPADLPFDDTIHRIVYDEESFEWFYVRKD